MFCIDASVIISAAKDSELSSNESRAFLDFVRRERAKVFLPEIAVVEIVSGLARATKRPDFAAEFSMVIRTVPNFVFVAVDGRLADLAVSVVCKIGLKSADAIYVAWA